MNLVSRMQGRVIAEPVFIGAIDDCPNGVLRGWIAIQGSASPVEFSLVVDDVSIGRGSAVRYRADLARAGIGQGNHAFEMALPPEFLDGGTHVVRVVPTGAAAQSVVRPLLLENSPRLVVDEFDGVRVRGWAAGRDSGPQEVEVLADGRVIARATGDRERQDVRRASEYPSRCGFQLEIPLRTRASQPINLELAIMGYPSTLRPLHSRKPNRIRIVIVCNSHDPRDGSRVYRGELASHQLRTCGVDVEIISEKDASDPKRRSALLPEDTDILVLQRIPFNQNSAGWIQAMREAGRLILYDVDDLLFKHWYMAALGAVRSGVANSREAELSASMEARLKLLLLCDAVICSTAFLQRELQAMGVRTILSRNSIEDEFFGLGSLRLAGVATRDSKQGLRLLFMSGSHTHNADFLILERVLPELLRENRNISLTILGHLERTAVDGFPNVVRVPRLPRDQMLQQISEHDAVLVPLEKTRFNLAKSSVKFIEAASAAVPTIASPTFEFKRDVLASGGGILAGCADDWRDAILRMAANPQLSYLLGERAFRYAFDRYSQSSRRGHLWNEILRLDDFLHLRRSECQAIARRLAQRDPAAA